MKPFRSTLAVAPLVAVLGAAVLALGCASGGGSRVSADKVAQIQVGQTTQTQIEQWFGEPTSRSFSATEGETWVYDQGASTTERAGRGFGGALLGAASSAAGPAGGLVPGGGSSSSESTTLSIVFDRQGRVADYSYASQQ